jgi:hypothetical protein
MKGHFKKGRDCRRHKLTTDERRRGWKRTFEDAMLNKPWLLHWLRQKVKQTMRKL